MATRTGKLIIARGVDHDERTPPIDLYAERLTSAPNIPNALVHLEDKPLMVAVIQTVPRRLAQRHFIQSIDGAGLME